MGCESGCQIGFGCFSFPVCRVSVRLLTAARETMLTGWLNAYSGLAGIRSEDTSTKQDVMFCSIFCSLLHFFWTPSRSRIWPPSSFGWTHATFYSSHSDVDLNWHMHAVSDGERRRVQIVSGLMAPWEVLLLDEVTVDLDVLVRSRLLNFLVEECETRGASILYATHIFDGLDTFPTHLCHLQLGTTIAPSPMQWPIRYTTPHRKEDGSPSDEVVVGIPKGVRESMEDPNRAGSRLLEVALAWLKEDRVARIDKEISTYGSQQRGAKDVPADSEAFYKK